LYSDSGTKRMQLFPKTISNYVGGFRPTKGEGWLVHPHTKSIVAHLVRTNRLNVHVLIKL